MTAWNPPHKLRDPVIIWVGHFDWSGGTEPAITSVVHFGEARGVALHRATVDAQRAGNAAGGPAFGDQGLNGLLLGHFEDVGHAP